MNIARDNSINNQRKINQAKSNGQTESNNRIQKTEWKQWNQFKMEVEKRNEG